VTVAKHKYAGDNNQPDKGSNYGEPSPSHLVIVSFAHYTA
jgi:hypothetical protein